MATNDVIAIIRPPSNVETKPNVAKHKTAKPKTIVEIESNTLFSTEIRTFVLPFCSIKLPTKIGFAKPFVFSKVFFINLKEFS